MQTTPAELKSQYHEGLITADEFVTKVIDYLASESPGSNMEEAQKLAMLRDEMIEAAMTKLIVAEELIHF